MLVENQMMDHLSRLLFEAPIVQRLSSARRGPSASSDYWFSTYCKILSLQRLLVNVTSQAKSKIVSGARLLTRGKPRCVVLSVG